MDLEKTIYSINKLNETIISKPTSVDAYRELYGLVKQVFETWPDNLVVVDTTESFIKKHISVNSSINLDYLQDESSKKKYYVETSEGDDSFHYAFLKNKQEDSILPCRVTKTNSITSEKKSELRFLSRDSVYVLKKG